THPGGQASVARHPKCGQEHLVLLVLPEVRGIKEIVTGLYTETRQYLPSPVACAMQTARHAEVDRLDPFRSDPRILDRPLPREIGDRRKDGRLARGVQEDATPISVVRGIEELRIGCEL